MGKIIDKSIQGKLSVASSKKQENKVNAVKSEGKELNGRSEEDEAPDYHHFDRFDRENDWGG